MRIGNEMQFPKLLKDSPPILIVHGGKDYQVGIHQAYYLAEQLEHIGATYRTFYQMEEGHIPRPFALKSTLSTIKQWMTDVEAQHIKQNYTGTIKSMNYKFFRSSCFFYLFNLFETAIVS